MTPAGTTDIPNEFNDPASGVSATMPEQAQNGSGLFPRERVLMLQGSIDLFEQEFGLSVPGF